MQLHQNNELYSKIQNSKIVDDNKINYYGDGNAAVRIRETLLKI